jgi:hypothetical protein
LDGIAANANNYTLPAPNTTTLGGVKRNAGSAGQFVTGIDEDGSLLRGTPAGGGSAISNPGIAYIRSDGNDTTGDGSPSAPYLTIAKAITEGYKTWNLGVGTFVGGTTSQTGEFSIIGAGEGQTNIGELTFAAADSSNSLNLLGVRIQFLYIPSADQFTINGGRIDIISNTQIAGSPGDFPSGSGGVGSNGAFLILNRARVNSIDLGGGPGGEGGVGEPGDEENPSGVGGVGGNGGNGGELVANFCRIDTTITCGGNNGGAGGAAGADNGGGVGDVGDMGEGGVGGNVNLNNSHVDYYIVAGGTGFSGEAASGVANAYFSIMFSTPLVLPSVVGCNIVAGVLHTS